MEDSAEETLTFEGSNFFRQRLVLATLSSKSVRIIKIRKNEEDPGLKGICHYSRRFLFSFFYQTEYEAGFVRLLDRLTNGSRIVVNETGEKLMFDAYQAGAYHFYEIEITKLEILIFYGNIN